MTTRVTATNAGPNRLKYYVGDVPAFAGVGETFTLDVSPGAEGRVLEVVPEPEPEPEDESEA